MRISSADLWAIAVLAVLSGLAGCGGGGNRATPVASPGDVVAGAVQASRAELRARARMQPLLDRLPEDPPACVLVSAGSVASRRRALIGLVSAASELAWLPGAPWTAWVEARASTGPDLANLLALAQVTGPPDETRRFLDAARLPVGVQLGDCSDPWCIRVRFPTFDSRLVELTRGALPARRPAGRPVLDQATIRSRCREALRDAPGGTVEVAVQAGGGGGKGLSPTVRTVVVDDAGVEVVELGSARGTSSDDLAAFLHRELGQHPGQVTALPHRVDRFPPETPGGPARVVERYLWEDLELAVADRRRMLAAASEVAHGGDDPERVDVERLDRVHEAVRVWGARTAATRGRRRRVVGAAYRRLLDRAREAHPEDPEIAMAAVRAYLDGDPPEDPARALEIVEDIVAARVGDPHRWRRVRREAAASADLARGEEGARLPGLLVADGLVSSRAAAARAAASILAWRRAGVDHEVAEAAWAIEGTLAPRPRLRPIADGPVDVPVSDLPTVVAWLVYAAEALGDPPSAGRPQLELALWAEGDGVRPGLRRRTGLPRGGGAADGGTLSEAIAGALPGTEAAGRFLALAPLRRPSLAEAPVRRVGARLAEATREGSVRVGLGLRRLGSTAPPRVLFHVAGDVDAVGAFHLRTADAVGRRVPWSSLDADIIPAVGALERIFPEPEVAFRGAPGERSDLRALGRDQLGIVCRDRPTVLQCRAVDRSTGLISLEKMVVAALAARVPTGTLSRFLVQGRPP